jgi:hypothetical protein
MARAVILLYLTGIGEAIPVSQSGSSGYVWSASIGKLFSD